MNFDGSSAAGIIASLLAGKSYEGKEAKVILYYLWKEVTIFFLLKIDDYYRRKQMSYRDYTVCPGSSDPT